MERDALRRQNELPSEDEATVTAGRPTGPAGPVDETPDQPRGGRDAAESPEKSPDEVSARLLATRMALEGSGRDQICEAVEASYDIEAAGSLVDDLLERLG